MVNLTGFGRVYIFRCVYEKLNCIFNGGQQAGEITFHAAVGPFNPTIADMCHGLTDQNNLSLITTGRLHFLQLTLKSGQNYIIHPDDKSGLQRAVFQAFLNQNFDFRQGGFFHHSRGEFLYDRIGEFGGFLMHQGHLFILTCGEILCGSKYILQKIFTALLQAVQNFSPASLLAFCKNGCVPGILDVDGRIWRIARDENGLEFGKRFKDIYGQQVVISGDLIFSAQMLRVKSVQTLNETMIGKNDSNRLDKQDLLVESSYNNVHKLLARVF